MATVLTRPITIDEFELMPADQTDSMEIVRGQLVPKYPYDEEWKMMAPGARHGEIQTEIGLLLRLWAKSRSAGFVGTEAGYVLEWEPLTMRIPDISFLSALRRPIGQTPEGVWRVPPDLAVEIISPSERQSKIQAKIDEYIEAGVALVWTVWPDRREVIAYTPDDEPRTYRIGDTLEFHEILPGFSCRVDDIFAQEDAD